MERRLTKKSTEEFINIAEDITEIQKLKITNEVKELIHVEEALEEPEPYSNEENKSKNSEEDCSMEESASENVNVEVKVNLPDDEMKQTRGSKFKNRWKKLKLKQDGDHPLVGLGLRENDQWSSMEALGIFGLLTPAVAAVPASDEFDTIHKQVRRQLGDDWEIQLAAAHVDDALKGRGKHGKARSYFKKKSAQRCFRILDNVWYQRIFLLIIIVHSMMIFIEPPSKPVLYIHGIVIAVDSLCMLVYIFDLVLRIHFLSWPIFWSLETEERYWNGVQFVLVCLFWIDFIVLCASSAFPSYVIQPFRCLRLAMLLCRLKTIRHIFEVLMIISHNLMKVLFIILIFIITFASIGVHLYMTTYNTTFKEDSNSTQTKCCVAADDDDEAIYIGTFDHVGAAMLRLFVLLSTENYPEIMLPALRKEKLNFFFFGVYVFFGGFFLTAILLAIVVDTYWIFAKKTVKRERARERTELAKAWNLLDPLGLGALAVTDKQFLELFRILKPNNTDEQNLMLVELLDSQGDGEIDSFEWTTTLRQALNAEFEENISFPEEEGNSKIISRVRGHARSLTESAAFSRVMLCLILLHGLLFCLKWKGQSQSWELGIHATRSVVAIIFVFEITLRFFGFGKHLVHFLELTDVTLVFVAVVFNLLWYIKDANDTFKHTCVIISSLSVIFRWMLNSSGTRKAFRWILNIVPVMFDLVALLFVILYLLSTIAMELFYSYGKPSKNEIYPAGCGLGFKNFWCSFLVMFQTLTTSNWHEIMNLTRKESKSQVAYFFFPLCYLITTMIVMNLFVAIAIEAANKLTSNDPTGPTHRTTEQEMQVQPKSFNETAKKVLAAMAKHVFDSARVDDRNKRQQMGSPNSSTITMPGKSKGSTIILSSPKKDANSNTKKQESDTKPNDSEEEDSDDNEDYSGLSPKEKREKQLKNRMKKKRKARQKKRKTSANVLDQIQQQVRAIASFRGSQPTDLDLIVGDTITVVATRDEWIQGKCKGVTGWFPASHVVNWTAKARVASANRLRSANENATAPSVSPTPVADSQATPKPTSDKVPTNADSLLGAKISGNHAASLLSPQPNYRIKIKKSGDWRREILGDMTVMNAEEMRELNKVMRAELRGPRGRGTRASGSSSHFPANHGREVGPTIEETKNENAQDSQFRPRENTFDSIRRLRTSTTTSNDVFLADPSPQIGQVKPENNNFFANAPSAYKTIEEERPVSSKQITDAIKEVNLSAISKSQFPTVSVSQMATLEFSSHSEPTEDANKPADDAKDFLGIDVGDDQKTQKKKVKNTGGEIPEWAKKFVEAKNIDMHNDVKFPEPTLNDGNLPGSVHSLEEELNNKKAS